MKYAIIESGGKQYRAVEGGLITVDLLPQAVGEEVVLDRVLLTSQDGQINVGSPTVAGASVKATVLEHFQGRKILVFKYKPKIHYRKKTGHRQQYTRLQVESISLE